MNSLNNLLIAHIENSSSHLCVGLDISPELIDQPTSISKCIDHSKKVIDATFDLVAAFKPNLAFYERWGSKGFAWLEGTLDYINDKIITIADG